jgi:hypothetical protein
MREMSLHTGGDLKMVRLRLDWTLPTDTALSIIQLFRDEAALRGRLGQIDPQLTPEAMRAFEPWNARP